MQTDPAFPPHPFWDFSLQTYRGAVPAACLSLQERHGLDVNILLYLLWRGREVAEPVDGDAMPAFLLAVAGWHETVVRSLRRARQATRTAPAGLDAALVKILHDRILQVEIASEHAEQLLIADLGNRHWGAIESGERNGSRQAAARNIQAYLVATDTPLDDPVLADVEVLLAAVFGPPEEPLPTIPRP